MYLYKQLAGGFRLVEKEMQTDTSVPWSELGCDDVDAVVGSTLTRVGDGAWRRECSMGLGSQPEEPKVVLAPF